MSGFYAWILYDILYTIMIVNTNGNIKCRSVNRSVQQSSDEYVSSNDHSSLRMTSPQLVQL